MVILYVITVCPLDLVALPTVKSHRLKMPLVLSVWHFRKHQTKKKRVTGSSCDASHSNGSVWTNGWLLEKWLAA